MALRTVRLEHLRPHEILEEKARCGIVYLPVGPLEWHGPAMPYGTDPIAAEEAAREAARMTGGVVMPTLYFGTERERPPELLEALGFSDTTQYIVGQDFPKNSMESFYTKEDVFSLIVREALRLLICQGYRLIVIVNGHGARNQQYQLERLAVELTNETNSNVMVAMAFAALDDTDGDMGHATRHETAVQMHLGADNVDLSKLPPRPERLKNCDWGIDDACTFALHPNEDKTVVYDPRDATPELGAKYHELGARHLTEQVAARWGRLNAQ